MKISYNWLQQFLLCKLEAERVAELLTDLGLEVEGIENISNLKTNLEGFVVGKILACTKHPNADKLQITQVDLGQEKLVQIICGAPNVSVGQKVLVATPGSKLNNEQGIEYKIKKSKIRGEESCGMICSEEELGLAKSSKGIMVLNESLTPGTPCAEVFNAETDFVFEIGLTPNRSDAMSHLGVSRDLRAGLIQQGINLELITPSVSDFQIHQRILNIEVEVENNNLASRYCGLTMTNIEVKESPKWIQKRLKAIGISPKNNVVDISNYVLHELGQPLHIFDASKIKGNKIIVKTLKQGTKLTTLDGIERELNCEDIIICDAHSNPLCLAGIYGGLNSGLTKHSTVIFIESACFNSVSIRKTAKRQGLNTDASFRFERGVDINMAKYALKRAALLIEKYAGGKISSDISDFYPNKTDDFEVFLSFENTYKLIGQEISKETIKNILVSLNIKINSATEAGLGLSIPPYKIDVRREADVIEEILRVYGYNNIRFPSKLHSSISLDKNKQIKTENRVANHLCALGFSETIANPLTKQTSIKLLNKSNHSVKILNPLSNELEFMQQSLLFSGLENIAYNLNRKQNALKFFEFGKSYHKYSTGYKENKHLAILLSGNKTKDNWIKNSQSSAFFYLKGVVVNILSGLGINLLNTKPSKSEFFSEGITLSAKKNNLVEIGVVKKTVLKEFSIQQQVLYADFNWQNVLNTANSNQIKVTDLPKFPSVTRDLALLLNQNTKFDDLYLLAFKAESKRLKELDLFDVYQGDKLPEGKKSYALRFILQDDNKTLKDNQIDFIMKKIQQSFEKNLKAVLR
ncbi:MAG: phenylalanine--tRNA ligase subunit beta [Tenacibaculum sp.]